LRGVCLLACLAVGAAVAWATRPKSLLDISNLQSPSVEQQGTVREQYFHAMMIGTEESWESVAKYFPPWKSEENRYYSQRAAQRLAELNLESSDLDQAMKHYTDLADANTGEPEFRAIGLVGQANVHLLRGELNQANQRLAALVMLFSDLQRPVQQMLMLEVNPRLRPELDQLIREYSTEDGTVPTP
jgi:hypothetical protein